MDNQIFEQFLSLFSYTTLLSIIATLFTTWIVLFGIKGLIQSLVNYNPKYRIQLSQTYPVIRILLWVLAIVYIVVGIIQPPQSVIYTSLGSLGLALGLASQDAIRNLVAGIMMAISPRFKIGDMIRVNEQYGEVISLDLSNTKLHTFDDNIITVPNGDILKSPISNANNGQLNEQVSIDLHLPVSIPVSKLKNLALEATKCSYYVYLKKPITATVFPVFERDFYYHLKIKAYVLDVRLERAMASDISERVIQALESQQLFNDSQFSQSSVNTSPLNITATH